MVRAYFPELLEESQKELANFIRWCNKIYGYYPIIIGGWAVWALTKYCKSIDIDVILPSPQAVYSLLMPYYKVNNFKSAGFLTKEFFREIKTSNGTARIYLDAASYSNKNLLKEDGGIEIPWRLLEENSREHDFDGAKARIPTVELLLIYKVKAVRDRKFELKNSEGILSGVPAIAEKGFLESKIKKDENDIRELLKTKMDKSRLERLLKKAKFAKLFAETIKEIEAE